MRMTGIARLARATVSLALLTGLLLGHAVERASAASCVATGALDRDGTPLTARLVNPPGPVSGTVDATGCDIGVYYGAGSGRVSGAEVFGARYFGVLVDGNANDVSADVSDSRIHDIGEVPRTNARHGEGIAYRSFDGGSATGSASGNTVWGFQEAGLNMTGPGATVTFSDNRVIGPGPQPVLEQNGIQVIFGAHGSVRGNEISGMSFTGPDFAPSAGILVVGGPGYGKPYTIGAVLIDNTITGADTGIVVVEIEANGRPSAVPTATLIQGNVIVNDALNNLGGHGQKGYQAGVLVHSNADRVLDNRIGGNGYDKAFCGGAAVCTPIDARHEIDPIVSGNILR
jgi:hypothetical protein